MSTDFSQSPEHGTNNDVELRELVYQSLERDGILSRIRAQLRAAVFKTVEKASKSSTPNTTAPISFDTRICRAVILDWLEQTRSLYTKDIFQIETSNSSSGTISDDELFEYLHLDSSRIRTQPILQTLIHQSHSGTRTESSSSLINVTSLPDSMKQSIDARFPTEKINDLNRVREHFRSLFSSAFDTVVLDAYLQKSLPLNSISKYDYEQICLKWLQSCSKVLHPTPLATPSPAPVTTNGQIVTRARRALSPTSDSSSSASSDNPRQGQFAFTLPTIKKAEDIQPPKLSNLKRDDDDDDDTTSSIFSRKNATPAALDRLKNIEDIAQGGGETPRTRTTVEKFSSHGNKDLPIEYDDESFSQSQMSSIDDVTVDKASPSPSAQIDFLEDL